MTRVLTTVPGATAVVSGSAVTHSQGGGEMEGGTRDRQKETGGERERNVSTNEIASLYTFSCILISLFFFLMHYTGEIFFSLFSRRNIILIFKIERSKLTVSE